MSNLIRKYNVPGPRYTSYPTVPYWDAESFSLAGWKASLARSFQESNETEGLSIYIHLPFCESLCTFCGCNKRITRRHEVEEPYIAALLKEWALYCDLFDKKPTIKELHLGGGTPTFFNHSNLERLIKGLLENATLSEDHAFSFEGHPNNTTAAHLQSLYDLGFRRVSFGVQDYNEKVQRAIHRIQPFSHVEEVTRLARQIGYTSVGHDIIFGLPFQTRAHVENTIKKTKQLMPDRIAFYSYAHVPWIKGNGQRGFRDQDLPSGTEKRQQYETGKKLLGKAGYVEIGMDHFSLETDALHTSMVNGSLHRNFMGYTASKTQAMIGLGVSAISDSWYGFAQNVKRIEDYYALLEQRQIPVFRGHLLGDQDLVIRKHILNLMCQFSTSWEERDQYFDELPDVLIHLREMLEDELLVIEGKSLRVTERGKPFVRNICMAFDLLLQRNRPETQLFSQTV